MRHSEIQKDQTGLKVVCLLEDIVSVDCFTANFKIVLGQVGTNGFSKKAAVVSDQYTVGHRGLAAYFAEWKVA
jgi:hypothetical protein